MKPKIKQLELGYFTVLKGKTIGSVSLEQLTFDGETLEVLRIDHSGGTHWIVAEPIKRKKKLFATLSIMGHEQYGEVTEPEEDGSESIS